MNAGDQSSPQMGPFPPNEVGRIAQHVREGERRNEGKYSDWKPKSDSV